MDTTEQEERRMGKSYPYAKTVDSRDDYFGTVVEDPYRWLEDAKNPEVLDFVSRENAYTSAWFEEAGAKYGMSINDFTEKQRKASDTFFIRGSRSARMAITRSWSIRETIPL